MFPVLLDLGFFKINTYGTLIVLGFLVALGLIRRRAKIDGFEPDTAVDLAFWALLMGLLGSRILYILTQLDYFIANPLKIIDIREGGLVFYGGFISGAATFIYFCRKYKFPMLKTMDMAVPSLAIAQSFGRIGCFFAGCCYGKEAVGLPWAIIFPPQSTGAPPGIPLHPTQLYDSLNTLIIFGITFALQSRKKFHGQVLATYMLMYAVGRSIVESYRGDTIRKFWIEPYLSTSQGISIFIFIGGILVWYTARNNSVLAPAKKEKKKR